MTTKTPVYHVYAGRLKLTDNYLTLESAEALADEFRAKGMSVEVIQTH